MEEAKVTFILEGVNLLIQCCVDNKMRDICQKYLTKVNKNFNTLSFLYGGSEVNFNLTFKEQATLFDRKNKKMKILVYENINDNIICPKCGEIIKVNKEKIDNIVLSNKEIKDNINGINFQIENMIKTSSMNTMNNQLKNINKILYIINEEINKNIKKLKCLLTDNNAINDNIINNHDNNTNNIHNENLKITKLDNNENKEEIKKENLPIKTLLENIQSNNIFNKVFSNLDVKVKLKSIKYNKYLKKKINISLIHYKYFSGKYIIFY